MKMLMLVFLLSLSSFSHAAESDPILLPYKNVNNSVIT